MAARYWRLVALDNYGDDTLELSEIQLWHGGSRVDTGATISTSIPPIAGALEDISDGSGGTSASWNRPQWSAAGFQILWDMGSAVDVSGFVVGSGSSKGSSLRKFSVESSSDAVTWTRAVYGSADFVGQITYVFPNTLVDILRPKGYRYWRLLFTRRADAVQGTGNAGFARLAEWQLFAGETKYPHVNLTGYNTPSPYVASASGELAPNYAWQAFDGDITDSSGDRWLSNDTPAGDRWLQIDLGVPQAVDTIKIAPDGAVSVGSGYYIVDFKILASNTGLFAGEHAVLANHIGLTRSDWSDLTLKTFGLGPQQGGFLENTEFERPVVRLDTTRFAKGADAGFDGIKLMPGTRVFRDMEASGTGRIAGTVKVDGDPTDVPVRRKVRLYRDIDGLKIRETWSDPVTGAYEFVEIDASYKYTVISYDHLHSHRAVVSDNLMPEAVA